MDKLQYALNYSLMDWTAWCTAHAVPAYMARQIFQWIFQKGCVDPTSFSNVPIKIRELLKEELCWDVPHIESRLVSSDGSEKFLLKTFDSLLIEMVLMPYAERVTLCVSSQVGCRMGCAFCQTGKMGYKRDLGAGEILAQVLIAQRALGERRLSNVVFMGMGEPLDNYDNVVAACRVMLDPMGFALSKRRVTISTAGLVEAIRRLGRELPIRLAISLHAVEDEQRSALMPVNRKFNLAQLKAALLEYPYEKNHGITFEYLMIAGVNDSLEHAKKLVRFLHGLKAKVNLIPVNHFPGMEMRPSEKGVLEQFQAYLSARSIPAPIRHSRGQDVSGGCGQLAAKRQREVDHDPRSLRLRARQEINSQS